MAHVVITFIAQVKIFCQNKNIYRVGKKKI